MGGIFTLFGEIAINADKANQTIGDTAGRAGALAKTFSKMGNAAVTCGKIISKGIAVGAAAVGVLLKQSIGEYAEYEQLVGGVETLFKESSGKVMEYANNAYKTAGLSANSYMETVTSFSASLLQGLGGDTSAAADIAHVAITDMADNANKMGTSMEMLQNAYQGFSKGQFQLLDNLKLGYGGSKTEMERLLAHASTLPDALGKEFDISNYADIIEAIHLVQEEMGIAGTTAKEASETISGSASAMKSAWSNLITGLSDENADVDLLVNNLLEAGKTYAKNVAKVLPTFARNLKTVATTLWGTFQDAFDGLGEKVPGWISSIQQKISSAWVNKIYPAVQKMFKTTLGVELPDWATLVTDVSDGWNNTVWPAIQNFFKVYLGVELPDWATLTADVTEAWNGTIWPSIQNTFKMKFGIELPDWNVMVTDISGGWNDTIWPSIQNLFKAKFGIEIPDWSEVKTNIDALWENVKGGIEGYFKAVFSILTPDEGDAGKGTVAIILEWWLGIAEAIGNLMLSPFGIELPDVVQQIKDWWENVKSQVKLSISFSVNASNINTSSSGGTHGGGAGQSFDGSHARGLYRVPFDGYRAILHEDEAVLNASEAAVYRGEKKNQTGKRNSRDANGSGQVVNVTQNIQAVPMTPSELAAQTKFALGMMRFSV